VVFRGQGGDERSTFGPDEPISVGVLVNSRENIVNPTIEIKLKSLTGIEILHVIEQVDASFSPNSREVIKKVPRWKLTNEVRSYAKGVMTTKPNGLTAYLDCQNKN
jgi:hypothetical protein